MDRQYSDEEVEAIFRRALEQQVDDEDGYAHDELVAVDHPDALPGITRATLLEISGATSRPMSAEELATADEIFVVGTSAEVTPITRLDGRDLAVGQLTRALAATYQDIVHGRDATFAHWLTYAEPEALPLDDAWSGLLLAAGGY